MSVSVLTFAAHLNCRRKLLGRNSTIKASLLETNKINSWFLAALFIAFDFL